VRRPTVEIAAKAGRGDFQQRGADVTRARRRVPGALSTGERCCGGMSGQELAVEQSRPRDRSMSYCTAAPVRAGERREAVAGGSWRRRGGRPGNRTAAMSYLHRTGEGFSLKVLVPTSAFGREAATGCRRTFRLGPESACLMRMPPGRSTWHALPCVAPGGHQWAWSTRRREKTRLRSVAVRNHSYLL
jgi:hypothetical protein